MSNKKLKIAIVSSQFFAEDNPQGPLSIFEGSLASYTYRLARSLQQFGHTPVLFVSSEKSEKVIFDGIEVYRVPMENKVFSYLGKISYGLYMFHPIAIVLALEAGIYFGINHNVFFYLTSLSLTILIASLSYNLFEKKFLKRKLKYSVVISGELAHKI